MIVLLAFVLGLGMGTIAGLVLLLWRSDVLSEVTTIIVMPEPPARREMRLAFFRARMLKHGIVERCPN